MSQPIVALVTARAARELDYDLAPLTSALGDVGAAVEIVDWDDSAVEWSRFDVALLRSTWDYAERIGEFLRWAERVAPTTTLLNPLPVVRWNTDKHYLRDLSRADVPTVPTEFAEPGDDAERAVHAFLERHDPPELVVKPAVGAGSRDAQRYQRSETEIAVQHVARLLAANRSAMLQPYLAGVDREGETALVFIEGRFSHAVRKGPLLRAGASPTSGLFAEEHITPRAADADELRIGHAAVSAAPFDALLYARVDLVRDESGGPCVLELELTEPSLFFEHGRGSAERFADAIVRLVALTRPVSTVDPSTPSSP